MLKNAASILIILTWSQCNNKDVSSGTDKYFSKFNANAKEAFLRNSERYDLYPMADRDQCILKEGVSKYLDEMNNYKLVHLDSFLIRNYSFEDLGCNFSMVAIRDRFYFLFLPRFYEYLYTEEKYEARDTIDQLRSPDYAIARINSATFDSFLEEEVFVSKGNPVSHAKSILLLKEIFPELTNNQSQTTELTEWITKQPFHNREVIEKIVTPVLKRKPRFNYSEDFVIFHVEYIGYILFDIHLDDEASLNVIMDIYFMPYNQRYGTYHGTDEKKFAVCFDR
jgi:hypothetical protein